MGVGFRAKTWGFSSAKEKVRPSSVDVYRSCSAKKTEETVLCAALQKKTEEGFALKKGFRNKFIARLLRALSQTGGFLC